MKILKNIVPLIALCTISTIDTKGLKSTSTTTSIPEYQPKPNTITNQPVSRPQPSTMQQEQYNQILHMLQDMQPTTNDFNVLVEIQKEVNNQIAKAKYQKNTPTTQPKTTPAPQPKHLVLADIQLANALFSNNKHNIPILNKTEAFCKEAARRDRDIFTETEQIALDQAIESIVEDFLREAPNTSRATIAEAIIFCHRGFIDFKKKLTPSQYQDVIQFIQEAVDRHWVYSKSATFDV